MSFEALLESWKNWKHICVSVALLLNIENFTGLFSSAFFVSLLSGSIAHVARFTKAKGWGLIAFLRVPIACYGYFAIGKFFGGVSKCPRDVCA